MAFGRNTWHALHCRLSPPTLLPASQEKSRLTEQYSLRTIWQLHSTMCTINNYSIMPTTPTIRHWLYNYVQNRRVKVQFQQKQSKGRKVKAGCGTWRSSVSSALQLLSGRLSNTASEHQADQVWRWHYHPHIWTSGGWHNQWPQHLSFASAQLYQQQKTECQWPNLHWQFSR